MMKVAFWLLFANGLIGLYDAIVYHILTFKLYKTQATFWEQLTHVIRGAFYAVFYVLTFVKLGGAWWWLIPVVMTIEFANTSIDCVLEPYTRRTLGGVPPTEYAIHCVILFIQGFALCAMLYASLPYRHEADGVTYAPLDLGFFSWLPIFSACLATALAMFEGTGFVRMALARMSGGARPAPATM